MRVAQEVIEGLIVFIFSSKYLNINFLGLNFFLADILELLKKKGLRYHSQHLILIHQKCIIISQQEIADQKYTGSLIYSLCRISVQSPFIHLTIIWKLVAGHYDSYV